jgi:hypothetical protein
MTRRQQLIYVGEEVRSGRSTLHLFSKQPFLIIDATRVISLYYQLSLYYSEGLPVD